MSGRKITFDPNAGHGDMLTEVVRAYLYTGNPSALMGRILKGIQLYRDEVKHADSDWNRVVYNELEHMLLADRSDLSELEENEPIPNVSK